METESSRIAQPYDDIDKLVIDLGVQQNQVATYIINYGAPEVTTIPMAEALSIQQRGVSHSTPVDQQPEDTPMEEEEYDQTHQPDDGVGILHDHSYGVKDKQILNMVDLDMNKDEDLRKGLDRALPGDNNDEDSYPEPPCSPVTLNGKPATIQDSQEKLAKSLKNRKLLLRELKESKIRCLPDVMRLNTDKMRQLAPRLVRFLMYEHEGKT